MPNISDSTLPLLRGPVPLSHLLLPCFLHYGGLAVDATCGNGNDTLLLAELVGTTGHVWGFDLQQQAIQASSEKLDTAGLFDRVTFLQTGHEELSKHIKSSLQVVLFNLGYLPGGDRTVITKPETTVSALEQSLELLADSGVIIVTIYPGHSGGSDEQQAVEKWAAAIESKKCFCWRMGQTNVRTDAPYLLLVQKAPSKCC